MAWVLFPLPVSERRINFRGLIPKCPACQLAAGLLFPGSGAFDRFDVFESVSEQAFVESKRGQILSPRN
jgi:hypothetical protein